MTRGQLNTWLNGVTCTRPFTCADARELYTMIKNALPNAFVEVYTTRGDKVHVRIGDPSSKFVRALDVV